MLIDEGAIPAGAMTIIVIAAVAIGIGFMTLICTLINLAKNRRRIARLQSLSPERVISPGACSSLSRRLPSLTETNGHFVLSFIPRSSTAQITPISSDRAPKPYTSIEDAPPPSYEDALRMAIEESLRHTEQTPQSSHIATQVTTEEAVENSIAPAIPPRRQPNMPLPKPQAIDAENNNTS
ncbi:hypothetical protein Tcan_02873 [Toxocara canis]|uniref:Uncharacterized protein n=1 Tax=Toxocara canis TaxID=6265 RepID=A0A0B2VA58_TOXCA|nr:hypothetical protein Tcan_02873 [Toxocara canis]